MEERIGYGNLTNLIKLERVWMVTHKEGRGTEDSPMREIKTFFDEDSKYLHRKDVAAKSNDGTRP